jgi:hypothetical protein
MSGPQANADPSRLRAFGPFDFPLGFARGFGENGQALRDLFELSTFPGAEALGYYRDAPPGLVSGDRRGIRRWRTEVARVGHPRAGGLVVGVESTPRALKRGQILDDLTA